jgi:aminoglycoside phosphotransferase (APT) family kinase protein
MFKPADALKNLIEKQIIRENALFLPFTEGTTSIVGRIEAKNSPFYVLKINEPSVLKMEVKFLQTYKDNPLFPKLVYVNSENQYILYNYIEGSTFRDSSNKSKTLSFLSTSFLSVTKSVARNEHWGWLDEPSVSWSEFMTKRVIQASSVVYQNITLTDIEMVKEIAHCHKSIDGSYPYLLHGDFGYHNFLFRFNKLTSVIDPTPILGPPIYDLVYAFCSTPSELTLATIQESASQLGKWKPESKQSLIEEVLVGLFCRISTCIKRHPEDLPSYMEAWSYWTSLYNNETGKRFL